MRYRMIEISLLLLFNSFLILFIISMVTCGIYFIIRTIQLKLLNLIFIGIGFLLVSFRFLGNFFIGLGSTFEEILVSIGFIFLVIFTNLTFHKDRKNGKLVVFFIVIMLSVFQIILDIHYTIEMNPTSYYLQIVNDLIYTFITFNWLTYSTYQAYRKVKNADLEPWIKVRYKVIIYVSVIMSFQPALPIFLPWNIPIGNPSYLSSINVYAVLSIQSLIFGLGFSIVWIMPKKLKRILNNGYVRIENQDVLELSEDDLISKIKQEMEAEQ